MKRQTIVPGGQWMYVVAVAVVAVGPPIEALLIESGGLRLALGPLLAPASAALVLVASALSIFHWYVVRATAGPWVGIALALLSIRIVVRHVLPLAGRAGEIEQAVGITCLVVAVVLLGHAATRTERLPSLSVLAATVVAAAAAVTVGAISHHDLPAVELVETAIPLLAWGVAALCCMRCARRENDACIFGALALVALAIPLHFTVAAVHDVLGFPTPDRVVGLLFLGAVVVAAAAAGDVRSVLDSQRDELAWHRGHSRVAAELARCARQAAEERAHEARNALVAIEGAVRILERSFDALPAASRCELSKGVYSEVKRLQLLVAPDDVPEQPTTFDVGEVIAPVITAAQALGVRVASDVAADLEAFGEPVGVAAAVNNLLTNVRLHADGSPARLDAWREEDTVVIEVADDGPGVPGDERHRVFDRGMRGASSAGVPGEGLGLFVARRTALRHGGELRYVDRPGAGAVFRLELVAADSRRGAARRPRTAEPVRS